MNKRANKKIRANPTDITKIVMKANEEEQERLELEEEEEEEEEKEIKQVITKKKMITRIIKIMREVNKVRMIGQTTKRMIRRNMINSSRIEGARIIVKRIIAKLMKENKIKNKIPGEVIILTIIINQNKIKVLM